MNIKNLIVVAAVLATGSAFAQNAGQNPAGGKTRAEVYAELQRDYDAGINANNRVPEFVEANQLASSRKRDQVRADAAQPGAATSSGN